MIKKLYLNVALNRVQNIEGVYSIVLDLTDYNILYVMAVTPTEEEDKKIKNKTLVRYTLKTKSKSNKASLIIPYTAIVACKEKICITYSEDTHNIKPRLDAVREAYDLPNKTFTIPYSSNVESYVKYNILTGEEKKYHSYPGSTLNSNEIWIRDRKSYI